MLSPAQIHDNPDHQKESRDFGNILNTKCPHGKVGDFFETTTSIVKLNDKAFQTASRIEELDSLTDQIIQFKKLKNWEVEITYHHWPVNTIDTIRIDSEDNGKGSVDSLEWLDGQLVLMAEFITGYTWTQNMRLKTLKNHLVWHLWIQVTPIAKNKWELQTRQMPNEVAHILVTSQSSAKLDFVLV